VPLPRVSSWGCGAGGAGPCAPAGRRAAASMTGRPAGGGISTWAPPSGRWRPRMRRLDGRRCGRVRFHTERGNEYSARVFRAACDRLDITQSMGRPGSALDNAVIEVLALHPRVRAAARRELPDHNRGPPEGGGIDPRLQPGQPPLLDRHDLRSRTSAAPTRKPQHDPPPITEPWRRPRPYQGQSPRRGLRPA
jgi:hypothetical protein